MILDKGDRYKAASIVAAFVIWWVYIGKGKYSVKGMTKRG